MTDLSKYTLARDAVREGASTSRLARSPDFVRITRGAYVDRQFWQDLGSRDRHLEILHAFDAVSHRRNVFSHESAAALWDLPIIGPWPENPQVTLDPGYSLSRRSTFTAHHLAVAPIEVRVVDGLLVTSRTRTAVDVAARSSLLGAVVILDAAAATDGTPALAESVEARRPFRGVRRVDAAMSCVTGRAESPLESLSMLRFMQFGLPRPTQQQHFRVNGHDYWVDFYWPEYDVIGEADGLGKYEADPAALVREKRREDDLRSVVTGFARWEWEHAWRSRPLAERLARAGLHPDRAKSAKPLG